MARQLRIDIDSDSSGARRGFDAAAAGVDHLRKETDRLESEFREASRAAAGLDKQLAETRAATRSLAAEFAKTRDVGVGAKLDQERAKLRDLDRLRADIIGSTERDAERAARAYQVAATAAMREAEKVAKAREKARRDDDERRRDKGFLGLFGEAPKMAAKAGTQAASTFAAALQGGLMEGFKSLPAPAQAGIAAGLLAAVAAAGPAIGAAINAAVLLGVGGGGLAAGIALAARSDDVRSAFSEFGSYAMAGLEESARPFRAELIASASIFRDALASNLPGLGAVFATLSSAVRPLARGLSGFVSAALPGIRRAAEAAVPLIKALADELPGLGAAASDFFDAVATGGPGLIALMREFIAWTKGGLRGFGLWIKEMGQVLEGAYVIAKALGFIDDETSTLTESTDELKQSYASAANELTNTRDAADALNAAFKRLFDEQLSLDEANLAAKQGFADLKKELAEGTRTLDSNTQAGRDNLAAIYDQIGVLQQQREATIAAGNGTKEATEAANGAYASQVAAIRKMLVELGYPPAAIDAIIAKYEDLARMPNITKTVKILTYEQAVTGKGGQGQSRGSGFASGTPSAPAGWAWTGERGPELINFRGGERVLDHQSSMALARSMDSMSSSRAAMMRYASASGGSSGGNRPLNIVYTGNPRGLEVMFLSWLAGAARKGQLQISSSAVVQ